MKFLAFNLAVGLALVFLFTADKGDVHKAGDRAHNLAADIKKMASDKIGNHTPKQPETPAPVPVASAPVPAPDAASKQPAKPQPLSFLITTKSHVQP